MAKKRCEEKERYWRAVLERQAGSGVSIAKFCRSEGVSEPSFYSWKRRKSRPCWRWLMGWLGRVEEDEPC